jgi:hypothetical protein
VTGLAMPPADLALLLGAAVMLVLRAAGVALAGALRPDHPCIVWAAAVAQAPLAALVTLAILAPAGALADLPLAARLAGLAAGVLGLFVLRGRLLPALGCGLAALMVARWALGA